MSRTAIRVGEMVHACACDSHHYEVGTANLGLIYSGTNGVEAWETYSRTIKEFLAGAHIVKPIFIQKNGARAAEVT